MQNDVVRWSSTTCCNNKHTYVNNNNKLYRRIVRRLCFGKEQQRQNVDKTVHDTIAFNESNNQSVKCDTNVYDLYLVQNIVNSSRYLKKNSSHKYFHQPFGGGKSSRRGYNNITNSYGTRLLFVLQLSLLVILCSLNIGFVTGANVEQKDISRLQYGLHNKESVNDIAGHYTHTWAVHIPDGDTEGKAQTVANDHGFINLGKQNNWNCDFLQLLMNSFVKKLNISFMEDSVAPELVDDYVDGVACWYENNKNSKKCDDDSVSDAALELAIVRNDIKQMMDTMEKKFIKVYRLLEEMKLRL